MLKEFKKIIENNPLSLATVTANHLPNLIVVAFVQVIDDQTLLITDNYMNQTIKDLAHNQQVCLLVYDKNWQGIKILGQATYHNSGQWLKKVKADPNNEGLPAKGAILVKAEKIINLH